MKKLNLKNHIEFQLIIFLMFYTILYLQNVKYALFISLVFVGYINVFYIGYYLVLPKTKSIFYILIFAFSSIFIIIITPFIIIIETFYYINHLKKLYNLKKRIDYNYRKKILEFNFNLIIIYILLFMLLFVIGMQNVYHYYLLGLINFILITLIIISRIYIVKKSNKLFEDILFVHCDSELMKKLYEYLSLKHCFFEIQMRYVDALIYNGEFEKANIELDNMSIIKKQTIWYDYAKLRIDYDDIVYKRLKKKINKRKHFIKVNFINTEVEIVHNLHLKNYNKVLLLTEKIDKSVQLNELKINYYKGICYFNLNRNLEASESFNKVLEKNNTLYISKMSKEYLKYYFEL